MGDQVDARPCRSGRWGGSWDRVGTGVAAWFALVALAALPCALGGCTGKVAASEPGSGPVDGESDTGSDGVPPLAFPLPAAGTQPAAASQSAAASQPAAAPAPGPDELRPGRGDRKSGRDARLTARIESAIAKAITTAREATKGKANGSNVVVAVAAIDLETGRVLVSRNAEHGLVPASNLKLMTVAAAALSLGKDAAFETVFEAHGDVDASGVLHGDLVVRAGGDPLHRRGTDGSLDAWLDPLAEALRQAGIQRIAGSLVLDEGSWLEPGPGPEWPAASEFWQQYCGFAAGFTANGSALLATGTAAAGRTALNVRLRPRHHGLKERIGVRIGPSNDVRVGATATTATVRGTLPRNNLPLEADFSHPDPVALFGTAFTGGLRDRGIDVDAAHRRQRNVQAASGTPSRVVHRMRTPVASTFDAILTDSNNPVADQVFLTLGARLGGAGTREASAAVVARALEKLGVDTTGLVQVDGSGLSKANRVTASQFVALVAAVAGLPGTVRGTVIAALPVAGETGSLSARMRGTAADGRVRAKTGWVAGASSLSGFAETASGGTVAFSILVGYPRLGGLNNSAWKPMQDEICVQLVEWSAEGGRR